MHDDVTLLVLIMQRTGAATPIGQLICMNRQLRPSTDFGNAVPKLHLILTLYQVYDLCSSQCDRVESSCLLKNRTVVRRFHNALYTGKAYLRHL